MTLQFASSVFQQHGDNLNLDSAILRLYKMNPRAAATSGAGQTAAAAAASTPTATEAAPPCREPFLESQIRVTVSIVHQQKKKRKLGAYLIPPCRTDSFINHFFVHLITERKKRTCNTIMLSSTKTGWVDIDVKCALTYWAQQEQQQRQQQQPLQQTHSHLPIEVGLLMIEVHDDEENQLLPGLYFQPPTCDQAGKRVVSQALTNCQTCVELQRTELDIFPKIYSQLQARPLKMCDITGAIYLHFAKIKVNKIQQAFCLFPTSSLILPNFRAGRQKKKTKSFQ